MFVRSHTGDLGEVQRFYLEIRTLIQTKKSPDENDDMQTIRRCL